MITVHDNVFQIPGSWTYRAKGAPDRAYDPKKRVWNVPNTVANRKYLMGNFLPADFDPPALQAASDTSAVPVKGVAALPPAPKWPNDLKDHQRIGLERAYGKPAFFFNHAMGAGKSRTLLELWKAYYQAGVIDEAWVICPNSLIDNWHAQVKIWAPELKEVVKVYGVLSLSAGNLPTELVKRAHGRLAVAVDESQRIKNSQAKRTKVMAEIGKHSAFRACLTGTNITKGVEDLYSQYNFLDKDILGHKSFFTFRNRYCIMGGFENKQIVGYTNLDELMDLIAPYTHTVDKPEELPPQTLEIRHIKITAEQKRLLSELKSQMQTEMAGNKLSVTNALAYYTRGAQILGGFFPLEEGRVARLNENTRLDELMEIADSTDLKIVVFCRFVAEADLVQEALAKEYGQSAVARIRAKDPALQDNVDRFQTDPVCRFIVSTYSSGAVGFTLTAGRILVEYSGTFNFEDAAQARKRIDRIGQEFETKVIRLLANSKLDTTMMDIADRKQTMADFVTGKLTAPRTMADLLD